MPKVNLRPGTVIGQTPAVPSLFDGVDGGLTHESAGRVQVYLGIDPGASGGLAEIGVNNGKTYVKMTKMPATERDIWEWISERGLDGVALGDTVFAVIEQVQGHVGPNQPGSAMFKFGQSYGALRMALIAAQIPFEAIAPSVWQRAFPLSPRGKSESRTSFKSRLKGLAQQLFPKESSKITLATCDALLLADYCRRKQTGVLK